MNKILTQSASIITLIAAYTFFVGYVSDKAYMSCFGLNYESFSRTTFDYISIGAQILLFPGSILLYLCGIVVFGSLIGAVITMYRSKKVYFLACCILISITISYGYASGVLNGKYAAKQISFQTPVRLVISDSHSEREYKGKIIFQDNSRVALYHEDSGENMVIPLSRIKYYSVLKKKAHLTGEFPKNEIPLTPKSGAPE